MSHNVLQQVSRFTNRTVKVKPGGKSSLVLAGNKLVRHAKEQGYHDQWSYHEQHHCPRTWRAHYRFLEHKRMYGEGMQKRVDFVESGYSAKPGFRFNRGVDDSPELLWYGQGGSKPPVDPAEWRTKYRHLLQHQP